MLPNESLLQVLHFADYKTLVFTKFAGEHFLRLVTKFAQELSQRRSFRVTFCDTYVEYDDMTVGAGGSISYVPGRPASLSAACREVAGVIGPHSVASLTFDDCAWDMPDVAVILEAAPPLKYAEDMTLFSPYGSTFNSNAFMKNFAGMKSLRFDNDVFRQFSWSFLGQECAHELRLIQFIGSLDPRANKPNDMNESVEGLVRYCATLPHLLGGETLELDFSESYFSGAFCLMIIEILKDSGRKLIFRMSLDNSGLILALSEYTVDVNGAIARYTSKKSGIVVDAEGRSITVRSRAEIRPTKRSPEIEEMSLIPYVG